MAFLCCVWHFKNYIVLLPSPSTFLPFLPFFPFLLSFLSFLPILPPSLPPFLPSIQVIVFSHNYIQVTHSRRYVLSVSFLEVPQSHLPSIVMLTLVTWWRCSLISTLYNYCVFSLQRVSSLGWEVATFLKNCIWHWWKGGEENDTNFKATVKLFDCVLSLSCLPKIIKFPKNILNRDFLIKIKRKPQI